MLWCFPESGVASEKSDGSSILVLLQVDVSCSLLGSLPVASSADYLTYNYSSP